MSCRIGPQAHVKRWQIPEFFSRLASRLPIYGRRQIHTISTTTLPRRYHNRRRGSATTADANNPEEGSNAVSPIIRSIIDRDLSGILDIEQQCFGDQSWSRAQFKDCLRYHNVNGMVAEWQEIIVGYVVYGLNKIDLQVMNFAVHPTARRNGIGTAMIDKLKDKLPNQRRKTLWLNVRERNLEAQLFFQANGMWCNGINAQYFDEDGEDAYEFAWHVNEREAAERVGT